MPKFNKIVKYINIVSLPVIWCILIIIKVYQYAISPYFAAKCRYTPTCSNYIYLSIKNLGLLKGGYYSIIRLIKCNPFGGVGVDPVKSK